MNAGEMRDTDLIGKCAEEFPRRVDREQLEQTVVKFWSDLQGATEGSMRLVSGFLIGRRLHGITRRSFSLPVQRGEAGSWVSKEASLGRDVYMKPSLGSPFRGKAPVLAIGAEVDRSKLAILPQPSISMSVTATRVQCYWRLAEPVSSAEAEKLVKRLLWTQERPMVLPGMPDNRGFGWGKFDCPECLPVLYSLEELAQRFPHLKSSGPAWEPGILRPIDLLAQRAGVITAVFGGGALRAGLASAAAAVAAIGGFLIPNPLSGDVPGPQTASASDPSVSGLTDKGNGPSVLTSPARALSVSLESPAPDAGAPERERVVIKSRLEATQDEGRARVEQIRETDELGMALTSGGELTRETFDRSTSTVFENQP